MPVRMVMMMMMLTNTVVMVDVLLAGRQMKEGRCIHVTLPETQSDLSVGDEVYKCNGEGSSSHRVAFDVAQPPLLVLLSVHHDHLALREGQLVGVVGYTVVDGFHSLWPLLGVGLPRHGGWRQRLTYGVLGASWHFLSCSFIRFGSI